MVVSGRIDPATADPRRDRLVPLGALLTVFALSAIFSQELALSAVALAGLAGIAVFWWSHRAGTRGSVARRGDMDRGCDRRARTGAPRHRLAASQGLDQIPIHVITVVWLGKLQITWVFNLFAPFLLARFIGDERRRVSLFNGAVWAIVGIANYLLVLADGVAIFVLTA